MPKNLWVGAEVNVGILLIQGRMVGSAAKIWRTLDANYDMVKEEERAV